jgi:hypothetical protein
MSRAGYLAVPALDSSHGAHLHRVAVSHCCTHWTLSRSVIEYAYYIVCLLWTAGLGSDPFASMY